MLIIVIGRLFALPTITVSFSIDFCTQYHSLPVRRQLHSHAGRRLPVDEVVHFILRYLQPRGNERNYLCHLTHLDTVVVMGVVVFLETFEYRGDYLNQQTHTCQTDVLDEGKVNHKPGSFLFQIRTSSKSDQIRFIRWLHPLFHLIIPHRITHVV